MWLDVGSIHDVVELNCSVISSEEKASIRDTDQRSQVQFDRTMVPYYEDEDISAAWILEDENVSAPFGYELINRCTFRDFNLANVPTDLLGLGLLVSHALPILLEFASRWPSVIFSTVDEIGDIHHLAR